MSGILKAIRRMFRGNKHNKFPEYSKKTDNFTSYVEEYGASVNSDDVSDGYSNVSFAGPLQPQDSTYDIPSSIYQIPCFRKKSVASLPNTIALDNAERGSQEPIYATIRKTKDTASQTDLSASSSDFSVSSISSASARTTPPPPPPLDFFNTADPLALCKERKKNGGNKKESSPKLKTTNAQDEMISELKKTLEKRRKASSSEDE